MTNQDYVKEFLSSRRAKITPEQAGLPDPGRPANNARFVSLDERSKAFFPDWEKAADDIVAILRSEAGSNPYDPDLSDLIGELSTRSETFRTRWAAHNSPSWHTPPNQTLLPLTA